MTDRDLCRRLRDAADHGVGDEALLTAAADEIESQQRRITELSTELEETNEGMVALTLELEEAEQRYRSLFENAVEGIYKTTPDGRRYVMANSSLATILGYESPEALQRAVGDVREEVFVDPERFDEYKQTLKANDTIENFEYRVRRRDGETRWVSDNARTLFEDGDHAGFRGGIIDITELKAYEQRLERKNEKLEALNRVVRHDIRNDVQVVRGFAEHLDHHVDEAGRDPLEKVISTTDHIIQLTDDAREFIESLTGPEDVQLEPTALRPLLAHEFERRRDAHPATEFHLRTEIPAVTVTANEMLSSVFRNLLNNAVQHNTSEEPVVELACTVSADEVVVAIADNGRGVPDEQKDKIFGKGEQSVDSDGTGMGLYLVHQLVSGYGGEVWVEDRHEWTPPADADESVIDDDDTTGAVFVVALPRED